MTFATRSPLRDQRHQPSSSQVNSSHVALENPVFVATVMPTITVCGMFVTSPVAVCCTVRAAAVCGMTPCVNVVSVAGRYDFPWPITCAFVAPTSGDVSARTCPSHSRYHGADVAAGRRDERAGDGPGEVVPSGDADD